MTVRRAAVLGARIAVPVALLGLAIGSDGPDAAQGWLAAAAVWLAGVLSWDLVVAARVERQKNVPVWRQKDAATVRRTPEGIAMAGALIKSASRSPRSHVVRLRPRLIELSNHYVPVNHGFSPEAAPDRLAALLGEDRWLVDPGITDRTPTHAEVSRFLDAILGTRTEER